MVKKSKKKVKVRVREMEDFDRKWKKYEKESFLRDFIVLEIKRIQKERVESVENFENVGNFNESEERRRWT